MKANYKMQNQKLLEGNIEEDVTWPLPSTQHLPLCDTRQITWGRTFVKVFGRGQVYKICKDS